MRFKLSLVWLLSLMGLFAAGDQEQSAPTAEEEVLITARSGDSETLDSAQSTNNETVYITKQVFDNLVRFKDGSLEIEPALAASWEISEDETDYTFHLRQGVKFHDGSDFNADAVLFSFNRQRLEDHPYYKHGPWPYWQAIGMSNAIKDIKKVDDFTIVISLNQPNSPFLANLAMKFASIVSPTAVKKWDADFALHPVGTGPYRFVSWQRDDRIILETFDGYWGKKPAIGRLVVRVIKDQSARWLALQNEEVDMLDFPSPNDIDAIKADERFKVVSELGSNVCYLALNTKKAPFDSVLVRRAINYAIDQDELIRAVYPGNAGVVAKSPIPPTMWAYDKDLPSYGHDPEKARELLAEAGFPDGFETTLWAIPVTRPYIPNGRRAAEIMQSQLQEVGIRAEIDSYDWATYLDKIRHGEHDMAITGWSTTNGDPDNFLGTLLSIQAAVIPASNSAHWENEEYDALVNQALLVSDIEKRKELYFKAQEIFVSEAPWVPLAHGVVNTPMVKDLQGISYQPSSSYDFINGYFSE